MMAARQELVVMTARVWAGVAVALLRAAAQASAWVLEKVWV